MKLIIGGAYQGKRAFAMEKLGIPETQIFTCEDTYIDFSKPCIDRLEDYVLACVRAGIDPMEQLKGQDLSDKVIICMDIFCGVVPIDETVRAWREQCGRTLTQVASRSRTVTRLFCGLDKRIKG